MTDKSLWITRLRAMKNAKRVVDAVGGKLFVFGSALTHERPRDLDLLLVYDANRITAGEACAARSTLRAVLETFSAPMEICLLSAREAESSKFVEEECCRPVW
jgi:hypothetical protein